MDEYYYASCAQLSMLLEVSANPKPGNIDRDHNFKDARYEEFLASAASAYPVFLEAYKTDEGVGELIKMGVKESSKWQKGGNTHFGAFTLLIPLIKSSRRLEDRYNLLKDRSILIDKIINEAESVLRDTDYTDSINFYKTFSLENIKVEKAEKFNVKDQQSLNLIRDKEIGLFNLMTLAPSHNLVAREWVEGYQRSLNVAKRLVKSSKSEKFDLNDNIVYEYVKLLSENIDGLVVAKHGLEEAKNVKKIAESIIKDYSIDKVKKFDCYLIEREINPGSTADIIVSALYIFLTYGGYKI